MNKEGRNISSKLIGATSQTNGHKIIYVNKEWIYEDTKEPISKTRPCKYCRGHSTKEGYDGCIGHLDSVKYACCGHGIEKPYAILNNGDKLEFVFMLI